jgi:hypothetical protein
VAADSLRDELMALPGVVDAKVDAAGGAPSGVRVTLQPEADAERVGADVQRVLASHGISSQVAADDERLAPVIGLSSAPAAILPGAAAPPPAPDEIAPDRPISEPPPADEPPPASARAPGLAGAAARLAERPHEPAETARRGLALASLSYDESPAGVIVTAVADDGQRFSRRAAEPTDEAVSAAVVAAVGALAEGRPQRLVWVSAAVVDDSEVVTVVVERSDGTRVAGAAVVRASKAYAVARAAYVALRS